MVLHSVHLFTADLRHLILNLLDVLPDILNQGIPCNHYGSIASLLSEARKVSIVNLDTLGLLELLAQFIGPLVKLYQLLLNLVSHFLSSTIMMIF